MSYTTNSITQKGFSIVTVNPDKLLFANNFVSPKGKIVNKLTILGSTKLTHVPASFSEENYASFEYIKLFIIAYSIV